MWWDKTSDLFLRSLCCCSWRAKVFKWVNYCFIMSYPDTKDSLYQCNTHWVNFKFSLLTPLHRNDQCPKWSPLSVQFMYQFIYRSPTSLQSAYNPQPFLLLKTLWIGCNKTWELWTNSQLCFPSFPTISQSARPGNLLWGDLWFSLCLVFLCTYNTWCWEVIRLCLLYRLRLLIIKSSLHFNSFSISS